MVDEGWKVLRVSPIRCDGGFNQKEATLRGIEYMKAVRQAVGDEIEIIFEVHTRLTPPHAIQLCNGIEEYHPFFVEDPIPFRNPASFATLPSAHKCANRHGRTAADEMAISVN